MKISEVFSGNYLKADDLQGKTVSLTIATVENVEFDNGNKIVITFQGKDKQLVCNKTNASIIAENLGSEETDNWLGHRVTLTVKKVEFQGKLVPAIRVVLTDPAPKLVSAQGAQHGILGKPQETITTPNESDDVPF